MRDLSPAERYKYLTALVVPRPIALVLTRNAAGQDNAARFSFFNTFGEDPPIVVLGLGSPRHHLRRHRRPILASDSEVYGA
jgi:flavin reductase (DIM6/NTAB) family NADH-FMN oxidoreductase RutF